MAEETITILRVDGGSAITTIKELREYIRQLKNELGTLTVGTEDYQSKLGTLITAQNALRGAMNATTASMEDVAAAAAGTGKSYNSLVNQMANLRRAQRSLNIEADEGKKRYAEMAVQINSLNDELKALDAQNGNYQRNVGNYKSAMDGLNIATAQIVRELPSAAIGFNTFFLAISNNIPMLIDQISNLRKTGASVPQVISAIGKSLLSFNSLVTVAITLLTLYGDKIIEWISSLFRGRDAVDSVADAMDNLNKAMDFDSLGTQVAEFQRLAQAYRDVGDNASAKQKFLEDYREELDKTGLAIYDITDADNIFITNSEKVVEAYKLRAQALAGMQLASEQYTKALEQQSKDEEELNRYTALRDRALLEYRQAQSQYGEYANIPVYARIIEAAKRQYEDMQQAVDDIKARTQEYITAGNAYIEGAAQLSEAERKTLADAGIDILDDAKSDSAKIKAETLKTVDELLAEIKSRIELNQMEITIKAKAEADNYADEDFLDQILREGEQENDSLIGGLESEDQQNRFRRDRNSTALDRLGDDLNARLDLLEQFSEEALKAGDMEAYLDYQQQIEDTELDIWKRGQQAKVTLIQSSVNAIGSVLGSLADIYEADAENSEEAARRAKNLRIAEATINTISGAVAAYMSAQSLPIPFNTIVGAVQAATVLAAGMAQIYKIKNTEINKDSAPSGSASGISASVSAPTVTPQVSNVRNVTSASEEERLNQMASSQKVYILSSDIEASQRQRKVQVQESSF